MAKRPRKPKEAPPPPGPPTATPYQVAYLVELLRGYAGSPGEPGPFTRRERVKALLNFARQPETVASAFLLKIEEKIRDWQDNPAAYWQLRQDADGTRPDR